MIPIIFSSTPAHLFTKMENKASSSTDKQKPLTLNPYHLNQILSSELPRSTIEKIKTTSSKPPKPSSNQEQQIISDYLVEHFQDIGGWKAKDFIEVEDITRAPTYKHYLPLDIQKFEIQEKNLPESIFEPPPAPDYNKSLYTSVQDSQAFYLEMSLDRIKKEKEIEEKIRKMEEKMKIGSGEGEDERMIKLTTRNKKVFAMVDDLMNRAEKRKKRGLGRR